MNKFSDSCKSQLPIPIKSSANPTSFSYSRTKFLHISLLKKCTNLIQFKQVHTQIMKSPFGHTDIQLAKLVESLVGSAQLDYAHSVFDQMVEPSTFAFNTMVRGYAANGLSNEGIQLYVQMRYQGIEPDNFTYPILLKACTDYNQGKWVHSLITKDQNFKAQIHSLTCLINFYCSYGDLESARLLFDRMCKRNVVTWTAMIAGYVKQGRHKEGLSLFQQMQIAGIEINELTLASVLSACANLGAYEMGKWVHQYIDKNQIVLNGTLAAALIDMYVKCGYLERACQVFQNVPQKSVCTWNSIIGGLALHGCSQEAIEKFEQMRMGGTKPDDVTLIGMLSACSHSGLVEKGKDYFYSMRRDFGIKPNVKHYGCLVDLLCRAGHLEEASGVIRDMPMESSAVLWGTLLNACAATANVELAEIAMEHLVTLEPFNDGNYVLMSNIYAAKGQWGDVANTRKLMKDRQIVKNPGSSLIEVDNTVHEFVAGDCRHPCSKQIYSMLKDVAISLKEEGDVEVLSSDFHLSSQK